MPMASASCVALRPARLGGRGVGQARELTSRARAASCACAYSMRTGLARAAAGPTEAGPYAWRPSGLWGAHLWMVGWYPWALKRLVTK